MKIEINKDFEEKYQSTYKGLTGGEMVTAIFALATAGIIAWAAWQFFGIPVNASVYFGLPIMLPIVFLGFYKYQGARIIDIGKELLYFSKTRELPYEAEEHKIDLNRKFSMNRSVKKNNGSI